jgi:hypothetical protein
LGDVWGAGKLRSVLNEYFKSAKKFQLTKISGFII